jgi:hypothetical protein
MKLSVQHYVLVAAAIISALGPFAVSHLTASQYSDAGVILGSLVALLTQVATLFAPSVLPSVTATAQAKNVADGTVPAKLPKVPLAMLCMCVAIVGVQTTFVMGCTAADLAAIQKADDALLAAAPMVCDIAEAVDPAGGAVVCAIVTATGDLVNVVTQQFTPAIASAIVKAHPTPSPAVSLKLKALAVKPVSR